eukprot:663492-Pleurochrysis_carterae.AAC.1
MSRQLLYYCVQCLQILLVLAWKHQGSGTHTDYVWLTVSIISAKTEQCAERRSIARSAHPTSLDHDRLPDPNN